MRRAGPFALLSLLVVCGIAVAWHYAARRSGGVSLPEGGALLVLQPLQRVLTGVGSWCAEMGRTAARRDGIMRENEMLRGRLADMEGQNARLVRYRRENEELRRLLQMPKPATGRTVAADVVSLDNTDYARRIILDVGSRHGVRPKDVVFAAQGVVGQVVEVAPLSSKVLLLTDRQSGVGAMTGRTMAKGLVRGTDQRICKMAYLDFQADVREGDIVLTSGDSNIFPKGLVIGRVLSVQKDKHYSQTSADIDPAVPFDQISAVYVRVQAGP